MSSRNRTRIYIGGLNECISSRELEDKLKRYGNICELTLRRDFGFAEFSDPDDAAKAIRRLDGQKINNTRIRVEYAKARAEYGTRREDSRDFRRGGYPSRNTCYNCGRDGHWARNCTSRRSRSRNRYRRSGSSSRGRRSRSYSSRRSRSSSRSSRRSRSRRRNRSTSNRRRSNDRRRHRHRSNSRRRRSSSSSSSKSSSRSRSHSSRSKSSKKHRSKSLSHSHHRRDKSKDRSKSKMSKRLSASLSKSKPREKSVSRHSAVDQETSKKSRDRIDSQSKQSSDAEMRPATADVVMTNGNNASCEPVSQETNQTTAQNGLPIDRKDQTAETTDRVETNATKTTVAAEMKFEE